MQGASRESLRTAQERFAAFAEERNDAEVLRTVADQLFATVTVLTSQAALRRALSDPALPAERKGQVVESLFGEQLLPSTLDVLRDVVARRWAQPVDMCDAVEVLAAQAAFTVAEQEGRLDEVEDELFRFERIVDGEPTLRAALTNRNLPADRKRDLVHRLLDGKAAPVTVSLIERAVLFPRGRTIERVIDEFSSFAAQRRSRLIARVTSAVPLTEEQQERLSSALARELGHEVRLQLVVDPSIIGGITVRVGDELLDASVLRQLGAAQRHLTGRSVGRS